jgi:hypothetical protein
VAVLGVVGKSELRRFEWCKNDGDWLGIDRVAVESAISGMRQWLGGSE